MGEQLNIEQYEVLVKRMKILSQSQTAFLKVRVDYYWATGPLFHQGLRRDEYLESLVLTLLPFCTCSLSLSISLMKLTGSLAREDHRCRFSG